jgi:hypothetical protein
VILGSFFNARETVAAEMPNALAMSLMVTLLEMEANGGFTGENSESDHNLCKRLHKNGTSFLYCSFVQGVAILCERLHRIAKICPASQLRIARPFKKYSKATG